MLNADGCLLLQAGKQMEWLTGGHVQAGMHEVSREALQIRCKSMIAAQKCSFRTVSIQLAARSWFVVHTAGRVLCGDISGGRSSTEGRTVPVAGVLDRLWACCQ